MLYLLDYGLSSATEGVTIEGRKTKTTIFTLANHSKPKQRQSDHGDIDVIK